MLVRRRRKSARIFLIIALCFCASCETPQGDFVDGGRAGAWNDIVILAFDADIGDHKIGQIKDLLAREPSTVAVTAFSEIPSKAEAEVTLSFEGGGSESGVPAHLVAVDSGFLSTFELRVISGRFFIPGGRFDATAVVINETASRLLSEGDQSARQFPGIIGERVTLESEGQQLVAQVIGVIEDYRFRAGTTVESVPLAFISETADFRFIAVRSTDVSETIARLRDEWPGSFGEVAPKISVLGDEVIDADAIAFRNKTKKERVVMALTLAINSLFLAFVLAPLLGAVLGRRWKITRDLFRMRGRVARGHFAVVTLITSIVTVAFFAVIEETSFPARYYIPAALGYGLAGFIQMFNIVKRFHDLGKHGANYWLLLVPIYNAYLLWILLFRKGTPEPNRYGENPLGAA